MKKILLLLLVSGIISTGCQKELNWPKEEDNNVANADITTGGLRAVEAKAVVAKHANFGWVLVLENNEIAVPQNLPEDFKTVDKKVKVAFFYTSKKVPCECSIQKYYIDIVQIELRF